MSKVKRSPLRGRPQSRHSAGSQGGRRSAPVRPAVAAVAALAAAGATAAPAFAFEAELVSRGDGVAGAYPIERAQTGNSVVTADGSTVYFVLQEADGGWAKSLGLYRRDVATNRTTLIVGGAGINITSLSSDGRYVGFTSPIGHVGSDTNKTIDLYGYDATTKKYNLVSRVDGVNGKPAGVTSGAYITLDGKSALFGTKSGVAKRDLATGKTTKIADGKLAGGDYAYYGRRDGSASADGKTYWVDGKIVSPRGTYALPGGVNAWPGVSPSGRWVVSSVWDNSGTEPKLTTTVLDTTNGATQTVDLVALFGAEATVVGFTPSDTGLVTRPAGSKLEVLEVNLAAGTAKVVASYPKDLLTYNVLSATGKYALSAFGSAVYLFATDGTSIPGGVDLPSPGVSLNVYAGCRASGWPFYLPAQPSTLAARLGGGIPTSGPTSLTVKVVNRAGAVVVDRTLTDSTLASIELAPAGFPFKVTATNTYADGRRATESWSLAAPGPVCSISL